MVHLRRHATNCSIVTFSLSRELRCVQVRTPRRQRCGGRCGGRRRARRTRAGQPEGRQVPEAGPRSRTQAGPHRQGRAGRAPQAGHRRQGTAGRAPLAGPSWQGLADGAHGKSLTGREGSSKNAGGPPPRDAPVRSQSSPGCLSTSAVAARMVDRPLQRGRTKHRWSGDADEQSEAGPPMAIMPTARACSSPRPKGPPAEETDFDTDPG